MSRNKSSKKRATVSIILFATLVLMPVSIILMGILKFNPDSIVGKIGHVMHEVVGLTFLAAGIFHIVYNWRTMKSYLKKNQT